MQSFIRLYIPLDFAEYYFWELYKITKSFYLVTLLRNLNFYFTPVELKTFFYTALVTGCTFLVEMVGQLLLLISCIMSCCCHVVLCTIFRKRAVYPRSTDRRQRKAFDQVFQEEWNCSRVCGAIEWQTVSNYKFLCEHTVFSISDNLNWCPYVVYVQSCICACFSVLYSHHFKDYFAVAAPLGESCPLAWSFCFWAG